MKYIHPDKLATKNRSNRKVSMIRRFGWLLAIGLAAVVISVLVYSLSKTYMVDQVEKRVRDTMLECRALHQYVQCNMHPAYYKLKKEGRLPDGFYAPELLSSSYIARNFQKHYNKERRKAGLPEVRYKMAAVDPRNPVNKANTFERDLIAWFNKDKTRTSYRKVIEKDSKKYLLYVRPFLATKQRCLKCHGTSEAAPAELRDIYQWTGGWNRKVGDIVAAEFIYSPLEGEYNALMLVIAGFVVVLGLGLMLLGFNLRLRMLIDRRTKELQESEGKYRTLLETTSEGFWILNPERKTIEVNAALCKMLGYSQDEMFGKTPFDFVDDENRKIFIEQTSKISITDHRSYEIVLKKKNGENLHTFFNATTIRNESGELQSSFALITDITERKQAEKALRESKEKYRGLFDNALVGLFRTRISDGKLIGINQRYAELVGCSTIEACLKDFIASESYVDPNLHKQIIQDLKEHGKVKDCEAEIKRRNGTKLWVGFSAQIYPELDYLEGVLVDINHRKQAEEALKRAERSYQEIFNASNEAIFVHDMETGAILDVNRTMCEMFEYTHAEALKLDVGDLSQGNPPYTMDHARQWVRKTVEEGPQRFEWLAKRKSGELFWDETNLKHAVIGGQDRILAFVSDITKRKRAQGELFSSEEKFSKAFRASPHLMGISRLKDGRYIEVNKSFCRITGYKHEEVIGRTSTEIGIWVDHRNREKMARILEEQGSIQNMETSIRTKTGQLCTVLFSAERIEVKGQQCLVAVVEDITERKQAEKALRESEEKYRSMMEAMDDAAYNCSPDFRVEYMNSAMIKRIGRDAVGESCHKVIHGLDEKCPWCVHGKVMQGEHIKTEIASPKDDNLYNISCSPIFHTDGSISQLSIFRNITETKKMEQRLQQSQKMESIGTLAGGIAHDFNNILMAIIGYGEIMDLFDIAEDNPIRSSLAEVLKAAYRAKDLVQQILTFSRQTEQEKKPLLLSAIVKEALKFLKASLPATIKIRQNIEKETGPILADATQMHQVLMNLCTNAAQAMGENQGVLEVNLDEVGLNQEDTLKFSNLEPGTYLRLTVSDTGHGMDAEAVERIFDPFFTTKKHGEGTGMGLSVVHGIVNSHNGEITVESEPGAGSTFSVFLPLLKKDSAKTQTEIILPPLTKGNESILLVDDEKSIVTLGVQILGRLGYKIKGKTTSKEALKIFQSQPGQFNLVITDLTMPDMTGVELAKKLLQIRPDIPIILCTGFSDKITPEKARAIGIREFINKPFGPRDLAESVRRVLDQKIDD